MRAEKKCLAKREDKLIGGIPLVRRLRIVRIQIELRVIAVQIEHVRIAIAIRIVCHAIHATADPTLERDLAV